MSKMSFAAIPTSKRLVRSNYRTTFFWATSHQNQTAQFSLHAASQTRMNGREHLTLLAALPHVSVLRAQAKRAP